MGAGLGGGSADAAYVLRGLRDLFLPELNNDELRRIAATLGSDCPLFIEDGPSLASGRGEILSPIELNLKGYYLKIVNPGIHIGTAEAYAGIVFANQPEAVKKTLNAPIVEWKNRLVNDFEYTAFKQPRNQNDDRHNQTKFIPTSFGNCIDEPHGDH